VLPVMAEDSVMDDKEHGSCPQSVQSSLRWHCDQELADRICCFNRSDAENSDHFLKTTFVEDLRRQMEREGSRTVTLFDSVMGKPVFTVPHGRTFDEFVAESEKHGWPSFRDQEVVWENVRCLADGEAVTIDGVHLGHNLPTRADTASGWSNRYCINCVSVAGRPAALLAPAPLEITKNLASAKSHLSCPIQHAGFLEKKSRHGKWQRRWWELRPPYLVYYAKKPSGSTIVGAGAESPLTDHHSDQGPHAAAESPGTPSKIASETPAAVISLASVQDCYLAGASFMLYPDIEVVGPKSGDISDREVVLVAADRQVQLRASSPNLAKLWAQALVAALWAVAHGGESVHAASSPRGGGKEAREQASRGLDEEGGDGALYDGEKKSDLERETVAMQLPPSAFVRPLAQSMEALESRFEQVEVSSAAPKSPGSDVAESWKVRTATGPPTTIGAAAVAPPSAEANPADPSMFLDGVAIPENMAGPASEPEEDERSNSMPNSIKSLVEPDKLWPPNLEVEVSVAEKDNGHPMYKTTVYWNGTEQPVCGGCHRFAVFRQLQEDLARLGLESTVELSPFANFMPPFSGTPVPLQDDPAAHQRPNSAGIEGDGVSSPIFPRTYRRTSFGIKLTDEQIRRRSKKLNSWLSSLVPDTALPLRVAMRLADFLGLQQLPYYSAWKTNQDARHDAAHQPPSLQSSPLR